MSAKNFKILVSVGIPLLVLFIPTEAIPIQDLTVVQQRVISLFLLAALLWILEPIPIYATSVLIIVLELVIISDKSFRYFIQGLDKTSADQLLSYKSIMGTFSSPIIMLFMGGFFLAMAATKYRLDQNLARVLLKPFGKNPYMVMMGLMIITAVFSMFMSNTATTAMMLSILAPVLTVFNDGDKGKTAFALAIPFAANVGGIATPIGTPPNAIALKYLQGEYAIGFGKWMSFGLPYVVVMLVFCWFLLKFLFPIKTKEINLQIKGTWLKTREARIVYFTFGVTIFLWLFDFLHGMNSYTVGLIPVGVFLVTKIITKDDLKKLSWDVLWLVSGGIALGLALGKTGLALGIIKSIPFETFPAFTIVIAATVLSTLMANFMSNTATANLLLPIIAALGAALPSLQILGGTQMLVLGTAMAASLGMSLPISTPPNALASATGYIETKHMTKAGIAMGIVGLVMIYLLMFVLNQLNVFVI